MMHKPGSVKISRFESYVQKYTADIHLEARNVKLR